MTHEELLAKIDECPVDNWVDVEGNKHAIIREMTDWQLALRAVVELHKPVTNALPDETCLACQDLYPCPTIQAIKEQLK